jgi:hypothetical protein
MNKNVKDLKRDINEFKKGYQNRWKNKFCQLLNVHGINDARQKCIQLSH